MELWSHHPSLRNILLKLSSGYRLGSVHLVDSHHCGDLARYVSVIILSLNAMMMLELPHVNVLSKVDLMEQYGELPYAQAIYVDPRNLHRMLEWDDGRDLPDALKDVAESLAQVVQEHDLVFFEALDVEDPLCLVRIVRQVDTGTGYVAKKEETLRGLPVSEYNYDIVERIKDKL